MKSTDVMEELWYNLTSWKSQFSIEFSHFSKIMENTSCHHMVLKASQTQSFSTQTLPVRGKQKNWTTISDCAGTSQVAISDHIEMAVIRSRFMKGVCWHVWRTLMEKESQVGPPTFWPTTRTWAHKKCKTLRHKSTKPNPKRSHAKWNQKKAWQLYFSTHYCTKVVSWLKIVKTSTY